MDRNKKQRIEELVRILHEASEAYYNDTDEMMSIEPHERIAQLVFLPYISAEFEDVDELEDTERGAGGFGSTGTN